MNKLVLGAASCLAIAAAAGGAHAQAFSTGFVGVSFTNLDTYQTIGAAGTGSFDVADKIEVQVDGTFNSVNFGSGSDTLQSWGGTVHGFYDTGRLKAGAYAGYEDLDGGTLTGFGLEGRVGLSDNFTLSALYSVGQLDIDGFSDTIDVDTWQVGLSAFMNDRTRVDASVTEGDGRIGSSGRLAYDVYSVGVEHQLEDFPYSLVFTAQDVELATGDDVSAVSIGVRRIFGGNLKDRDRKSSPMGDIGANFAGTAAASIVTSYDLAVIGSFYDSGED